MTVDVQGKTGRWGTAVDNEREAMRYVLAGGPWELARIYTDANELVGTLRIVKRGKRWYIDYIKSGMVKWSKTI